MSFIDEVRKKSLKKIDIFQEKTETQINDLNKENEEKQQQKQEIIEKINSISQQIEETKSKLISPDIILKYDTFITFLKKEKKLFKLYENIVTEMENLNEYYIKNKFLDAEGLTEEMITGAHDFVAEIYKRLINKYEEIERDTIEYNFEEEGLIPKDTESRKGHFLHDFFGKFAAKFKKSKYNPITSSDDLDIRINGLTDFKRFYLTIIEANPDNPNQEKHCYKEVAQHLDLINTTKNIDDEFINSIKSVQEDKRNQEYWIGKDKFIRAVRKDTELVDDFLTFSDFYKEKLTTDPKLLDPYYLQKLINQNKANNQNILDLQKEKKKLSKMLQDIGQKISNNKQQITIIADKRKKSLAEKEKVQNATLEQLGYKSRIEAAQKLGLEINDYLIIPIGKDISKITDLFNKERKIQINYKGRDYSTKFTPGDVDGYLNSIDNLQDGDAALMISLSDLNHDDIEFATSKGVSVNESVLGIDSSILILPDGRKIDIEGFEFDVKQGKGQNVSSDVEALLDENYKAELESVKEYDVIKSAPRVSKNIEHKKVEAIKNFLFQNIKEDITSSEVMLVDGEQFSIDKKDELEMMSAASAKIASESQIKKLIKEIQTSGSSIKGKVNMLYQKFLVEYFEANKKARAEYYLESDTVIVHKKRKLSLKPELNHDKEEIAKRFTRKDEHISYRTMKLANIVNRFAHMADEKSELQQKLFETKALLIERAIDFAKNNPEVQFYQKFDEDKQVRSVVVEVPGSNMIALHTMNKSESLQRKIGELPQYKGEVYSSSPIINVGVNNQFLMVLSKMNSDERKKFISSLSPATQKKLAIRMGIINDNAGKDEPDKENVLDKMCSDDFINELM